MNKTKAYVIFILAFFLLYPVDRNSLVKKIKNKNYIRVPVRSRDFFVCPLPLRDKSPALKGELGEDVNKF